MRVLILLFLAAFFFTASADESENKFDKQRDRAWALSNIGEEEKAEKIYQQLLQEPNVPLDIIFNYMDMLVAQRRYQETIQHLNSLLASHLNMWMLSEIPNEGYDKHLRLLSVFQQKYQNKEFTVRYAFKQAEMLLAYGKYQEAFDWVKNYKDMSGNRVYAAYFALMASELDETTALLDKVIGNMEYTPHEQQKAEWLRMDMKRFWSPHISSRIKFINNKLHGTFYPIESELMFPLDNWGRVTLKNYNLKGKNQVALKIDKVIGFKEKFYFSVLSSDNNLGFNAGWQRRRLKFYQFGFKGFYRDVETDVTALLKDFALKSGGEIFGYYKLGKKTTIGGSYTYNNYQLPDSDEKIGYMHILHPYFIFLKNDKNPTLQHGIGWVHIQGNGNTDYIVRRFDMPYYSISGLRYFGPYKNFCHYNLTIGYMRGENFQGLAATPKISFRYSPNRNLDFLGGLEYRIDSLNGNGETRGDIGIIWRFK
jgi:hypothetical protein